MGVKDAKIVFIHLRNILTSDSSFVSVKTTVILTAFCIKAMYLVLITRNYGSGKSRENPTFENTLLLPTVVRPAFLHSFTMVSIKYSAAIIQYED